MSGRLVLGIVCGLVFAALTAAAQEVTFESLLREMTDLEGLTRVPTPAFTCKQFSSYDRKSTDPAVLTDENWFANADSGQHLREEAPNGATEWVMMDTDGPGAIVRIWSANPHDAGLIRIYIDGAAEPTIEMPMPDALGGGAAPFIMPISGERSRGWNSYLPIPYAKHCKVTASQPKFYYHVNYRTYAEGAKVQSYTPALAQQYEALIKETAARLEAPQQSAAPSSAQTQVLLQTLAPGGTHSEQVTGPAAISNISGKATAENLEAALRSCVIEIFFDGEQTPSVQAPLGDFFGTAPGANVYRSLPSGVLDDGTLYSHWVMPFRQSAEIRFTNHGGKPITLDGEMVVGAYAWNEQSMYFHAKWRAGYDIPTRPRQDWTYLDCTGQGRFVGDMLHITNPVKDWWGEGDEKIYVDGEAFPSHFGTGSEDYYGYAWCWPVPFTHAYHNQPRCDGPGNYGQTCVSRFHVLDNIPFTKSFKFDIEVWHWADCRVAMAATSYWYARPGSADTFKPIDPADLKVVTPPPLPELKAVEGALEGESLKVISNTGGQVQEQKSATYPWSRGSQLWWIDAKPGDTLAVEFAAPKAGRYEVVAVFTKANDYGICELAINGKSAGKPRDFYNPDVMVTEEESLGVFKLKDGANQLTAKVTGRNDKAIARHMFGLDYLLLKPVK